VSGTMGEFPAKAKKLLDIANNNCERLLLLINDILDIEKIEAGKMDFKLSKVNLTHIVRQAIAGNEMYANKFDVSLRLIDEIPNIYVIADAERLLQVMANLISNACKFSHAKGEVTLAMAKLDGDVRVSVADKGTGIPLEFQPYLFQKFSQADATNTRGKGGTGLGLSISKSIMEKMGGTLNFISSPEIGTTFYFDLPNVLEEEEIKKVPLPAVTENKKRLLICEDDADQSEYLSAVLEVAGYETDQAHTVAQAKELLAERNYAGILLDLILPDQDGISFIRELRKDKATSNLPIIVISMIAPTGESLLKGEAISLIDWLEKPVDFNKLLLSIARIKKNLPDRLPHILHVEDDLDMQHVVRQLLINHATIATAGTLQQATQMLAKDRYDLVILDLLLPDGNGIEIIPTIVKHQLPILVFSAVELDRDYAQYVSLALIKGMPSNEDLLNTIMRLLQ
jgi:DNA-binding response OmpR family regulator